MNQTLDMSTKIQINNTPNANEVWKGIGGHFDFLSQIIHEFIDNSVSNFKGNQSLSRNIVISFKEVKNKNIEVSIEDQGTGIKDLNSAFCLGNTSSGDSPLNEHGFGMKHALASANPNNNNWAVYTRTKDDFDKNQFKKISSQYKITEFEAELIGTDEENWAGQFNGSGTFVRFECSWEMFKTLRKGIRGIVPQNIDGFIPYFKEDLGFVYSNILKDGLASISIVTPTNSYIVSAVEPNWKEFISAKIGSEDVDLGNGSVKILYEFGSTNESEFFKYYRKNQSSSGVEIRINGRLLSYNIFKDIWNLEPHPVYNHLLIKLNLVSNDKNKLPTTRTSKNGIREGDGKLEKIYEWVRKKYPKPDKDDDVKNENQDELSLFETLAEKKKIHLKGATVETEQFVFNSIGERARLDLYIAFNNEVTIYEGKKDKTTYKDVYQLRMYWDGCIIDGITPKFGILISANHPDSVKTLVDVVNQMLDPNGNNYNFILRSWRDEDVSYPK
jgi:hypothetical protein